MFKTLIALFIITTSTASMACPGASCKTDVELKVNLTQNGFETLKKIFLKKFDGEESQRSDYYFDIFQNNHYFLKTAEPPIKLRYMWNGKDLSWQTQKTTKTDARSIFSIKTTDAISMDIKHDNKIFEEIQNYHAALAKLDPYALTIAKNIQQEMLDAGVIDFTRTQCQQCTTGAKYFSTHMNTKNRVKIKLKLDDDQFTVQLGTTNNRGVVTYELEAEIKKSSDLYKSADRLNNWLQSLGFNSSQIDIAVPAEPTAISEEQLNKLFVLGVQNN
ncbi:MAG: hypothetical protein H7177_10710 [Rhizobacter sp.]|nr:hypothetical protein [Bacteriovorax sp.]